MQGRFLCLLINPPSVTHLRQLNSHATYSIPPVTKLLNHFFRDQDNCVNSFSYSIRIPPNLICLKEIQLSDFKRNICSKLYRVEFYDQLQNDLERCHALSETEEKIIETGFKTNMDYWTRIKSWLKDYEF
jgi:hypothetical protein